jgi:hypothetical protein
MPEREKEHEFVGPNATWLTKQRAAGKEAAARRDARRMAEADAKPSYAITGYDPLAAYDASVPKCHRD